MTSRFLFASALGSLALRLACNDAVGTEAVRDAAVQSSSSSSAKKSTGGGMATGETATGQASTGEVSTGQASTDQATTGELSAPTSTSPSGSESSSPSSGCGCGGFVGMPAYVTVDDAITGKPLTDAMFTETSGDDAGGLSITEDSHPDGGLYGLYEITSNNYESGDTTVTVSIAASGYATQSATIGFGFVTACPECYPHAFRNSTITVRLVHLDGGH